MFLLVSVCSIVVYHLVLSSPNMASKVCCHFLHHSKSEETETGPNSSLKIQNITHMFHSPLPPSPEEDVKSYEFSSDHTMQWKGLWQANAMNFLIHFKAAPLVFVLGWVTATAYLVSGVLSKAFWSIYCYINVSMGKWVSGASYSTTLLITLPNYL